MTGPFSNPAPYETFSVTLKVGQPPWVVVRAASGQEMVAELNDASEIGAAVGRADAAFQAGFALGSQAGAVPVQQAPVQEQPPAQAPAQNGWSAGPAQAPVQQYAPPAQAAPQQGGYQPAGGKDANGHDMSKPGYAPQPGPAPVLDDGSTANWRFGVGNNGPWKGWFSGHPKDYTGYKSKTQYIRG